MAGRYTKRQKSRKLASAEKVLKDLENFFDGDDDVSPATKASFKRWVKWAASRKHPAMPAHPAHLTSFFQSLARRDLAIATIEQYAAAIRRCHTAHGLSDPLTPEVSRQLKNIRRKVGSAPKRRLEKLTADNIGLIRETAHKPRPGESLAEAADRARMTIALISLMRDALLLPRAASRVRWGDISAQPDGTGVLLLKRSADFPDRRLVSAETMLALGNLDGEKAREAQIFSLTSGEISKVIRDAAIDAGLGDGYGGLSPRFGMAADMVLAGETLFAVMAAGGWRHDHALKLNLREELALTGPIARHSRDRRRP